MRLIDTETGEFVEFVDLEKAPPFAILSHTWVRSGEQSYQEVVKIQERYRHYVCISVLSSCSATSRPFWRC